MLRTAFWLFTVVSSLMPGSQMRHMHRRQMWGSPTLHCQGHHLSNAWGLEPGERSPPCSRLGAVVAASDRPDSLESPLTRQPPREFLAAPVHIMVYQCTTSMYQPMRCAVFRVHTHGRQVMYQHNETASICRKTGEPRGNTDFCQ